MPHHRLLLAVGLVFAAARTARSEPPSGGRDSATVSRPEPRQLRAQLQQWITRHPIAVHPIFDNPPTGVPGGTSFVIAIDDDTSLENTDWTDPFQAGNALQLLEQKYHAVQPDNVQFIVTFTEWSISTLGAFYVPEANDVRGIGYENESAQETFDNTGDSPLEGQLLMNSLSTWGSGDAASWVFCQELGHRWNAFVRFKDGISGKRSDALLGRDRQHWSYFLETGASPLEGNHWGDNRDGTYTTDSALTRPPVFAPLDLYLMGLIPATDVLPLKLLVPPTPMVPDGNNGIVSASSAPELSGRRITIAASPTSVTMDQIVAAEGPRSPAWDKAPREFHVGFQLAMKAGHQYRTSLLSQMESRVEALTAGFEGATGGRVHLIIESHGTNPEKNLPGWPCSKGFLQCDPLLSTACVTPVTTAAPDAGTTPVCAAACGTNGTCGSGCCMVAEDGNSYCFGASVCGIDGGGGSDGGNAAVGGGGGCSLDPQARPVCVGRGATWVALLVAMSVAFRRRRGRFRPLSP